MVESRIQRRLAAILAADVVGYSRMMEADEPGTLNRLKSLRAEFLHPKIAAHGGRIVKTTGDGTLVEFPSAVDAVSHAVEVQAELARRNSELPEDQRIVLRMGINVGDIMVEGDDIYGDGVNVAARLEALADPGGICISRSVRDQVRDKIVITFDDLGEQMLKNISKTVRAFRVMPGNQSRSPAIIGKREAAAAERPPVAVLPFQNISGDAEQEYFADGMAEDIITALSRFRSFAVVARNSSFTYKGRAVDVRQVGRELGVRYVLEGSVRKGGDRLRITAQLIDAATGNHLWADRFDGAVEDIFDLQDRITEGVVASIEPSIRQAEIERARRKRPESLDAYDLYLRALPHAWAWTQADAAKAAELLDAALRMEPSYVAAHGLAAFVNSTFVVLSPGDSRRFEAVEHARAVIGPDIDDSVALAFAAFALAFFEREYDVALDATRRAIAITPNSPLVLTMSSLVNAYAGQFDASLAQAEGALRLSRFDPLRFLAELAIGYSQFFKGAYEAAADAGQRCATVNPQFVPGLILLVASSAQCGRAQAAKDTAGRLLRLYPNFHVASFIGIGRFAPDNNERYAAALREAGLPE